ncbi:MAG: hypothetical protein ABFC42_12500 [Sulfuricella sp.]
MIAEIQAGYAGTKAALDIAKGIFALKTEVERNQAVIDIQRNVIEAQNALSTAEREYSASLKRIEALEQEIVRLKDWSGEMERYEARNVSRGAIAYVLKPGMENGEQPHWLCAKCFTDRRKSFLQPKGGAGPVTGEVRFGCDTCDGYLSVPNRIHPTSVAQADAAAKAAG